MHIRGSSFLYIVPRFCVLGGATAVFTKILAFFSILAPKSKHLLLFDDFFCFVFDDAGVHLSLLSIFFFHGGFFSLYVNHSLMKPRNDKISTTFGCNGIATIRIRRWPLEPSLVCAAPKCQMENR